MENTSSKKEGQLKENRSVRKSVYPRLSDQLHLSILNVQGNKTTYLDFRSYNEKQFHAWGLF